MKEFLSELHTRLNTTVVDLSFFNLYSSKLGGISQNLVDTACQQYTKELVASVRRMADPYYEDCVKLTQTLLSPLAQALSRQRGKHYWFGPEAAEPEYPAFDQVSADGDNGTSIKPQQIISQKSKPMATRMLG